MDNLYGKKNKKVPITAPTAYEDKLYEAGFIHIAGMDEVGRGPLAGPVVACAVVLPQGVVISGVNDSKKLSAKKRALLAEEIKSKAIDYALGWVDVETIEKINILKATCLAMEQAVQALSIPLDAVLVDGQLPFSLQEQGIFCEYIKGGDALSHSIAAASIVAKVERDNWMLKQHETYPSYGFDSHKGYGTPKHIEAIREHGICPLHRVSFLQKIFAEI